MENKNVGGKRVPTPTADKYQSIMDIARRVPHAHFKSVQTKDCNGQKTREVQSCVSREGMAPPDRQIGP